MAEPSDAVAAAMGAIKRRWFLPVRQRVHAGVDRPIPIGHGATNSQPRTVANMLRLLDVRVGDRVLDVGAGSGWTTALLANLVGPDGGVIGVELEPDLTRWGGQNLSRLHFPNARIEQADEAVLGWPDGAPYDRILVSASARALHQSLLDQLKSDGVMVIVVRSRMLRVELAPGGDPTITDHGSYSFVPLRT